MTLIDLGKLAKSSKSNFDINFKNQEIILTPNFKEVFSYLTDNLNHEVEYLSHTTKVRRDQRNIFIPNQWFSMAVYFTDFINELFRYKKYLIDLRSALAFDQPQFEKYIRNIKSSGEIPEIIKSKISSLFPDKEQAEFFSTFLSNYTWWYGGKEVTRNDFYVSPSLNLTNVVAVSQSYIADLIKYYTEDDALYNAAKELNNLEINQIKDSQLSYQKKTNTNLLPAVNLIVYGAPGTGKSYYLENRFTNLSRVVFHPEYSYNEFLGSYKPVPLYSADEKVLKNQSGETVELGTPFIDYSFVSGPFIDILIKAANDPNNSYTLLIEELNRANAAAVFGDIFQLLDRDNKGKSKYTISLSSELDDYLSKFKNIYPLFQNGLYLPSNLNIAASMNSADQGVFLLDSAFKRRWEYKYMPVLSSDFATEFEIIEYAGKRFHWKDLLNAINNKLKSLDIDEDRLIGHYFMTTNDLNSPTAFTSKLFVYLWDDVVRHDRSIFFDPTLKAYSDLVDAHQNKNDFMNLLQQIGYNALN